MAERWTADRAASEAPSGAAGEHPFFGPSALQQLSHCNKCGFCLAVCPTYDLFRLEPASPRGRLAMAEEVLEGRLKADRHVREQMYLCLGCRACETACPSGVQYSRVLEATRAAVEAYPDRQGARGFVERVLLDGLIGRRRRMRAAAALLWAYQASGLRALARRVGLTRRLPGHLGDLEPMLPLVQAPWKRPGPVPARAPARLAATAGHRGKAALFLGCIMDALFPSTNRAMAEALMALGMTVEAPPGQTCCGALHAHAGRLEVARAMARQNVQAFERSGADWVVNDAGGCGAMLKEYPALFEGDPVWRRRAEAFSDRVRDVLELLDQLGVPALLAGARGAHNGPADGAAVPVTYQDSCHLLHGQKVKAAPRRLLASLPGFSFVELPEADRCCGSAGIYTLTHHEVSMALLDAKMQRVRETGARVVATSNPGCYMQMRLGVARAGLEGQVRVAYVVDLVRDALLGPTGT